MFNSFSMTGTGIVVLLIEVVLSIFNINFPEGSPQAVVDAGVTIIGFILTVWGQIRRKDLIGGVFRKKTQ